MKYLIDIKSDFRGYFNVYVQANMHRKTDFEYFSFKILLLENCVTCGFFVKIRILVKCTTLVHYFFKSLVTTITN